jgi:hypothetical protein
MDQVLIKIYFLEICKDLPCFSIIYSKCVVFTVYYLCLVTSVRRKLTLSGDIINVKVKLSHYGPLELREVEASRIS